MDVIKILVVEDKESLRKLLVRLLQEEKYDVVGVASGEEAIEKIKREYFNLVLTDMKLPGLSGMEVLREARRSDSRTEAVVMTAY